MRELEATATKDGPWWTITIPELDQSAATKLRSEVQDQAERLATTALGADPGSVQVHVIYPLPGNLGSSWEEIRQEQEQAEVLMIVAAAKSRALVADLRDQGYRGSDIAVMLGLSVQRVSELLKPSTEEQ